MAKVKNRKDPAAPTERMTATDTLNLNPAFISRVKKEEGMQQSAMAQKLRQDMNRMKEEEMFPDMQFVSDGQSIPGHRLVLRSRLKNIFDDNWYESSSEGLPVLRIHTSSEEETREFMKVLYTSDDVETKFLLDALKKPNTAEVDVAKTVSDSSPATSDPPEKNVSDDSTICSQEHTTTPGKDGRYIEPTKTGSPAEEEGGNDLTALSEAGESSRTHEAAAVSASGDNLGDSHVQVSCVQKDPSEVSDGDEERHSPDLSGSSVQDTSSTHMKSSSESVAATSQAVPDPDVVEEPSAPHSVSSSPQTAHSDDISDSKRDGHEKSSPEESSPEQGVVASKNAPPLRTDAETTAASVSASTTSHTLTKEETDTGSSREDSVDGSANSDSQHQNDCGPALTGELQQLPKDTTPEPAATTTTTTTTTSTSIFAGGLEDGSRKQGGGDAAPWETSYAACSGLGEGLLQCYRLQAYTDCCLKVEGQQFLAHRCVLASRCQYFEAMFAGSWTESGEAEIELHGVSARAVRYMLLFLYGAMLEVPAADITPLIQASDMFGVEGLKDWLGFLIARDFCHFFHKPCQDCIRMVADVLVLASQFNLTSLAERGKRWVTTHFRRIWEMPNFGTLPPDLLEECTKSVIDQMSLQNITQMILDSHVLVRCLQQNRRAHPVQLAAVKVMDQALAFCAGHFPQLVRSPRFLAWSKDGAWCMDVLEESYSMVVSLLQPEVACDVYSALQQLSADSQREDGGGQYTSQEVQRLLKRLVERCEWYLHRYIHRVVHCPQWSALPPPLQQQLLQKCSFVPAHAASLSGAKSRVAQKSAKVLQDNIVHTVTMLCETNPDLFPSLAQTRKILSHTSKQPPPPQPPPHPPPPAKHKQSPANSSEGNRSSSSSSSRSSRPQTVAQKPRKENPTPVRQSEASKRRNTAAESASLSSASSSSSSLWSSRSRGGSGKAGGGGGGGDVGGGGGVSAAVSQGTAKQKKASSEASPTSRPASATSQGKGLPASSAQRTSTAATASATAATAAASSLSGCRPNSASVTSTRSQGKGALSSSVVTKGASSSVVTKGASSSVVTKGGSSSVVTKGGSSSVVTKDASSVTKGASSVTKGAVTKGASSSLTKGAVTKGATSSVTKGASSSSVTKGASSSSLTQPGRGVRPAEPSPPGARCGASSLAAKRATAASSSSTRPQSASASLATGPLQEARGPSASSSSARTRADSAKTFSSRNTAVSASSGTKPAGGGRTTREATSAATGSSAPRQRESQLLLSRPSSAKGTSTQTSAQSWSQKSSGLLHKSSSKHTSSGAHSDVKSVSKDHKSSGEHTSSAANSGVKFVSPGVSASVTSTKDGSGLQVETSRSTHRMSQAHNPRSARSAAASAGTRAQPSSARLPKGGSQPSSVQSSTSRSTLKAQSATTAKTAPSQASHHTSHQSLSKPDRQTSGHSAPQPVGSEAPEGEEDAENSASRQHVSTSSTREGERDVVGSQSEAKPADPKTSDSGHSDPEVSSAGGDWGFGEVQTAVLDSDCAHPVSSDAGESPQSRTVNQTTSQSNGPENSVSFASSETGLEQIQNSVQDISSENGGLVTQTPRSENAPFENSESVLAADSGEKEDDASQAQHDSIISADEPLEGDTLGTSVPPRLGTSAPAQRDDSTPSAGRKDMMPASNTKTDLSPSETEKLVVDSQHEDGEGMQVFDPVENSLQCDKVRDGPGDFCDSPGDFCHMNEAKHREENKTLSQEDDSDMTTSAHCQDRRPDEEEGNAKAIQHLQCDRMAQGHQENHDEMAQVLWDVEIAQDEMAQILQLTEMAHDPQDDEMAQDLQLKDMAQDLQDDDMVQGLQLEGVAQNLYDNEKAQDLQDDETGQDLHGDETAQDLQDNEMAQDLQDDKTAQGLQDNEMAQDLQGDELAQGLQDNDIALDLQGDKTAQYPQDDGMAQDLEDKKTAQDPQDEEPACNPQDEGRDMTSNIGDKEKAQDLADAEVARGFLDE